MKQAVFIRTVRSGDDDDLFFSTKFCFRVGCIFSLGLVSRDCAARYNANLGAIDDTRPPSVPAHGDFHCIETFQILSLTVPRSSRYGVTHWKHRVAEVQGVQDIATISAITNS